MRHWLGGTDQRCHLAHRASRAATLSAVIVLIAACTPAAGGTRPPSDSPSPAASVVPIVLNVAPGNLGCDAMGVSYRSATIHNDPSANDQVTATTDTNIRLKTFWEQRFAGGTSANPVVLDSGGQVVARDGEPIELPEADWPRLHGYFVCPSETAIYVMMRDPS